METKNQLDPSDFFTDITLTFWGITPEQEFCQTWGLQLKAKN